MRDPLVVEPSGEHDSSIIWMHGLGASAFDFYDMPRIIQRPGTRWIFPNAPVRPVTLNNGWKMPSWFDIRFLAESPEDRGRECPVEAEESSQIIRSLIQSEHEKGIPYDRIVLVGFSQGGAMSLYTGCRYPNRLGGMICLSGYLLFHDTHMGDSNDANRNTPILICHGNRDDMVPFWAAQESFHFLKEGGWPVDFEEYPIFHEISMSEIEKVGNFLSDILD
ncbi:MAG: alpha/beta fold hydrolase [Candidatus Thermoplasmatota archaeon]|nr:carboxylesterase [Euryarchaeota archaeon]MEC7704294.1 alpha/beta fold hydrolase [Candidatus Thermoplasmatota archaeon]MEC9090408.1 alpha/beta fold hydrolase [Candidatus Thermoplasmatota archaeon]MED5486451.1 alpha/beta fold hydrolase [Candidatus Thermoplasmatota archaeon]|tara:strand:- start:398 stop:1060 length:663 start_codon:yes stop_codon:yes gene_type:complete